MVFSARSRLQRATSAAALVICAGFLASCAAPQARNMVAGKNARSKEYFAESEYGVKASPRVSWMKSNLPRGGGRDQLGKPYKVRGKMYYPKEDKNYRKTGLASWYGDAFHGRLTANGEIYDTTHLTAAHPTMPLPSYARVTNLANGSSVIVRVNDRGPYSHGRLIDLSKRAAEMLDYANVGTAQVKVEYIGRAPLNGEDDRYLMASYQPGNKAPDPSDGLPTGVMVAMNGSTPSQGASLPEKAAFPGVLRDVAPEPISSASTVVLANFDASSEVVLPEFGPIVPQRPEDGVIQQQVAFAAMSYAPRSEHGAVAAFAALGLGSDATVQPAEASDGEPFVAAATLTDKAEADALRAKLAQFGRSEIEVSSADGHLVYSVNVFDDGHGSLDTILEAAWRNGAPDAIAVRD